MQYRCPKHDCVFETLTDHRAPGALAKGNFAQHPVDCHPDCPQRQQEIEQELNPVHTHADFRVVARG